MKDDFNNILKKYRNNNLLSQNDLVNYLTNNDDFLAKLDVVTLSRWENGKTAPSLEKKIRIMKKLDLLTLYLHSIKNFNEQTKLSESLNIRFGIEINKYKELNNFKNFENTQFEFIKNKKNLDKNLKNYLVNQERELCKVCNQWPIGVGCWTLNNKIEAFFIHLYANNNLYNQGHFNNWDSLYKKNTAKNINSIVLLDQATSTQSFYKLSFICLFDALIKNDHLEYIFIYINTDYFLKLSLYLGFDTIATITEPPTTINEHMDLKFTCILKIDAIKLLSNKDFLFFCLKSYYDLKTNNPRLLNLVMNMSTNIVQYKS